MLGIGGLLALSDDCPFHFPWGGDSHTRHRLNCVGGHNKRSSPRHESYQVGAEIAGSDMCESVEKCT